jgi:hypothetical protein
MLTQATGQQGAVKFGPVPAATLRAWRLVARDDAPHTWDLTATAVEVNRFYITQTPLQLSLRVGSRNWRWNDVVLEIVGVAVRGTVTGRPEVSR